MFSFVVIVAAYPNIELDASFLTNTRDKPKIIEFLKNKLLNMFQRIKKLVDFNFQDLLCIENKNKIEVIQDKRNNNLSIENASYTREQKERDYDDLELE